MNGATGRSTRREPGIAAVAEAAGVSYMTVSRVINGREGVGDATRERIQKIIDEIGYRPNVVARALRTGRTHSIGVVCFATSFHGPASLLFSVEQAARAAGFSVNVVTLNVLDEESIQLALAELRELAIEAIIVISPHRSTGAALRSMPTDVPVVAIWGPEELGMPVMGMDHVDAAARATRHLLDLGHPTVWHVSGPDGWTGSDLRVRGWHAALAESGREIPPVFQGDWLATSGYEAGQHILSQPEVSAVFLSNDQMALGFMAAARERGRRIPDDLSVIGYDDEPGSEFFTPPLTTVHQDFAFIGRRAFEFTQHLIESGTRVPAQVTALPAELVVRSSTGPYAH
ncbi:LacI family DNA-binding transcriptional regulator [Compostimonas suwonensis]|uniref:DNA-binding LacI/PurR family transcriptional regulator n=1 Tax=Compostimonas suwonensis TaxID=1048394 RepID=A0A2M9BB92_9MICO|nr:LacI family DNA-binding transcriptional regulator [Compostimonas suwonensis]PJJ55211.1 DNA-binding LacI/PurR family transcriptional regulator [Compostimonas suwonensis]